MTTADDMATLAGLGDAIVDRYLSGHADTDLVKLYIDPDTEAVPRMKHHLLQNASEVEKFLSGLIAELIEKVYTLENAV